MSSVIPPVVAHSENVDIHTPPYIVGGIPLTFDLDPASPLFDWEGAEATTLEAFADGRTRSVTSTSLPLAVTYTPTRAN